MENLKDPVARYNFWPEREGEWVRAEDYDRAADALNEMCRRLGIEWPKPADSLPVEAPQLSEAWENTKRAIETFLGVDFDDASREFHESNNSSWGGIVRLAIEKRDERTKEAVEAPQPQEACVCSVEQLAIMKGPDALCKATTHRGEAPALPVVQQEEKDCDYQDVECWERQLRAAGWLPWNCRTATEALGSTTWKSPEGLFYRGPYGAWKIMKGRHGD